MKKILWGSSTNAQQYEGGWDEDGKGKSISDVRTLLHNYSNFHVASDGYHRYKEDIELFHQMGFSIYRFSISWTRIFPNGDDKAPNPKGLAYYDHVVDQLIADGIAPVATLYAYDLPLSLLERFGGWTSRQTVAAYKNYVDTIFEHFKGRIKFYVPFNEPNLYHVDSEYIAGNKNLSTQELWQGEHHLAIAYAHACNDLHNIDSTAKIGPNCAFMVNYPLTPDPKVVAGAQKSMYLTNYAYLDIYVHGYYPKFFLNHLKELGVSLDIRPGDMQLLKNAKPDFISSTYYATYVSDISKQLANNNETKNNDFEFQGGLVQRNNGTPNPYTKETEWGWIIDPLGFYYQLMDISERYHLPILILENGIAHTEKLNENHKIVDDYRISYLRDHIEQLKHAINDGVDVIGYLTWSAIDLHSTREGFIKRYGFIYVDRDEHDLKTLKRYKKKSFYWYKQVIESNGDDLTDNKIDY
ncbi:glycoside hydrolase family 1 protein [Companilactobacillus huachuanensis]|uniref:Glycoside hydrolase family 1 protein n=1 Tax=Companilactobacillus huachuanensis TaxID=2559914 RepID=A0ABW1RL95_9LACO|nr:glycoside hydrolase family 1 protein [Companilactobacillus huachuanensis]